MKETPSIQTPVKTAGLIIHLELLFVVAIWAGTFVATKMVLQEIPPATSALLRYLIASIILLGIYSWQREKVTSTDYGSLVLLGLTGVTLYYLLQHYGIQYTNATDAALLISLSPIFIGLISWGWLKEPFKLTAGIGLILALTGTLLVIGNGNISWTHPGKRVWGDGLILLTAASWAVYSVYGKKLMQKYQPITIITYTTVIGTILLLPFCLLEIMTVHWSRLNWMTWLNLLYLGGAASVYGYIAWYRGLKKLPAVTVGSYLYFRPLLTGIIAAIVLQEQVGIMVIIGGMLIILGTYLTTVMKNN